MIDEKMEPDALKDMIYGESDPLMSSYHVSYSMVLNMMRVEDADPEDLLRRSFHQVTHTHSLTHSFIHLLTHLLTHSLTHSLQVSTRSELAPY